MHITKTMLWKRNKEKEMRTDEGKETNREENGRVRLLLLLLL